MQHSWIAQLNSPITAPYYLNNNKDNPKKHLSVQSVKEHNPSLLLTFDSHHQE